MAKPCKYTLADGTVLSYDEMRAYILENYAKLNPDAVKDSPKQSGGGGGGTKIGKVITLEDGSKQVPNPILTRYVEGENVRQDVREAIARRGLNRDIEHLSDARKIAEEFIAEVGISNAIEAVQNEDVKGAAAAFIWGAAIDYIDNEISKTTDPDELARLTTWNADLLEQFNQKAVNDGRFIRALADVYRDSNFGWRVGELVDSWVRTAGEKPSAETEALIKEVSENVLEINKKLKELQERVEKAEAELAIKNIQDYNEREGKAKDKTTERRKKADKAIAAIKNVRAKIKGNNYSDATGIIAAVDSALLVIEKAIDKGVSVADAIEEGIAHINAKLKGEKWNQDKFRKDVTDAFKEEGVDVGVATFDETTGRYRIPGSMIRDLVKQGMNDIDAITDAVMKEMNIENTPENHRLVRDSITGYGKTVNPTKDELQKEVSKLTGVGRLLSALEDVKAGKRASRSGVQRRKLTQKERDLMSQVRELTKMLPQDEADIAKYFKTALDALKTRMRNRMEDLKAEIESGEKQKKVKKEVKYDAEAQALKDELDDLQKVHDEVFKNKSLTIEEQVQQAVDMLENSTNRYEQKIAEGKFTPPVKPPLPEDPRIAAAQAKRDAAKKAYEIAREAAIPAEVRKAEAALKATEREIAVIDKMIAENNLVKERKAKLEYQTEALKAAKERLAGRRALLAELQEKAGIAEKKRLDTIKKNANKAVETYKRRLAEGNFEKGRYESKNGVLGAFKKQEDKRTQLDKEALNLQAEKLFWQNRYETEKHKAELKNRKAWEKATDVVVEAWGLTRALMATAELSFVLVQGSVQTIAHPTKAWEAFKVAMRNFASQAKAEKAQQRIEASRDYYVMSKSKLALSKYDARLTAREESFLGGWVNQIWDYVGFPFFSPITKKFKKDLKVGETTLIETAGKTPYEVWKQANLFKAIERAGVGYLNTIRVLRFQDGSQMLEMQGKTFENDAESYKQLADVINTFTGRSGLGALEVAAKPLSFIFFSPRNWASMLKQVTPYTFVWLGRMTEVSGSRFNPKSYHSTVAQRMALADFSKYLGLTTSIVMMAAAYLNDDDDEETGVSLDPRSVDFMKIKLGNTRIDPWGGRIQQIVYQTRMIMGETVNSRGEVKRLGEGGFTPTRYDLSLRMIENKFAPTTGMVSKFLKSKTKKDPTTGEYIRVDQFGQPFDLSSQVENFYPMYWGTVSDLEKEQPNALAGMLIFYSLLGGGVSTYERNPVPNSELLSDKAAKVLEKNEGEVNPRPIEYKGKAMTPEQFGEYRNAYVEYLSNQFNTDVDHYEALTPEQFQIDFAILKKQAKEKAIGSITK